MDPNISNAFKKNKGWSTSFSLHEILDLLWHFFELFKYIVKIWFYLFIYLFGFKAVDLKILLRNIIFEYYRGFT